jgi:hypothetical protein
MDTVKIKAKEAFSFSKGKAKTFYSKKRYFWGTVASIGDTTFGYFRRKERRR